MTRARDLASGLAGVRPFAMASGVTNTSGSGYATVTFPANRFTQGPQVTGTATTAGSQTTYVMSTGSSTTGVTLQTIGSTASGVYWVAIQMTSGAASG